jgi:tRNA dimethylallyltransferase
VSWSVVSDVDASDHALERSLELAGKDALFCIVGPTASGKTALALDVCARIGGEVVSADSIQIYRRFDIGSGKPSRAELDRVPHHLIDALDPLDPIDAAGWAKLADEAIADIRARGKTPVVCGGTFFWVRALLLGLAPIPAADETVRARHRAIVAEKGRSALHEELLRVDPESAGRLHPNDTVRVGRALEVFELTGRTMSDWQADHGFKGRRYEANVVALKHDPAVLTERIAARTESWLAHGWIEEVRSLLDDGFAEARAMGSVGYAEVRAFLEGRLARDELKDTIVRATRVYARRQRTWLNHADVIWL